MKGSLKIDVTRDNPKNLQPVIIANVSKNSDDARDILLAMFFETFIGKERHDCMISVKLKGEDDNIKSFQLIPYEANK